MRGGKRARRRNSKHALVLSPDDLPPTISSICPTVTEEDAENETKKDIADAFE